MSPPLTDLCQHMELLNSRFVHDLRGSLQIVAAYSELLAAETSLRPHQLKWVHFIQAGAVDLRKKIDNGQVCMDELIQSSKHE
jgi:hypothetical protein